MVSWPNVLRRVAKRIKSDGLTDRAGALTYFGVLAVFPALLVLVSVLGMLGVGTTHRLLDGLGSVVPGPVHSFLTTAIEQVSGRGGAAGVAAAVGAAIALWSASAYAAALTRAMNAIYRVGEGRPFWRTMPLRLGVTLALVCTASAAAVVITVSGPIARRAGRGLGLGDAVVTAWDIAKWPVLVVLVSVTFSLLYWATPNVRRPGIQWISAGGLLAVAIWLVVSACFGLYVARFGSYNKTYGSLAAVIIFLVWLWLTNLAILLGAELNCEIERERATTAGMPDGVEPFVIPRDTRKLNPADAARLAEAERRRRGDDAATSASE
ncbi:MAG: YihY/virulence factor BrkB family protein [Actinomycetia bacterium]|nr:YihY/virulence factor BrkB family protein [Actinomycetes bacterium]